MSGFWLFLHLFGVLVWVGGMFFAHLCLRPALGGLPAELRAPLMAATLGSFFRYVSLSIALIWISGLAMVLPVGMKAAPPGWHAMIFAGLLMTLIFGFIRLVLYPRLLTALADKLVAQVAPTLGLIRRLVLVNLILGLFATAAVSVLR